MIRAFSVIRNIAATGALILSLAGCGIATNHSKDFKCEAELGTPCTSMAVADGGQASKANLVTPTNGNTTKPYNPNPKPFKGWFKGKGAQRAILDANIPRTGGGALGRNLPASRYNAKSQRIPERLGTLWVASYLDADGILHDASYVHFVIQEAGWSGVH